MGEIGSEEVGRPFEVPFGWRGVRSDFAHFCRVAGARGLGRLAVLFCTPPLWALFVYRYGRWIYAERRGGRLTPLHKLIYTVAVELVRRIAKVCLEVPAEIGEHVWLGASGVIIVAPRSRIGPRCALHGQNTLGVGGRPGARGVPALGEGTVLAPGAVVVGKVVTPQGFVLGANAVLAKSPSAGGGWVGAPAAAFGGDAEALVPAWGR